MGIPPFSMALAGKTGPVTMIPSPSGDVNRESSSGPFLYEFVLEMEAKMPVLTES
jgi:hypothetical protein